MQGAGKLVSVMVYVAQVACSTQSALCVCGGGGGRPQPCLCELKEMGGASLVAQQGQHFLVLRNKDSPSRLFPTSSLSNLNDEGTAVRASTLSGQGTPVC